MHKRARGVWVIRSKRQSDGRLPVYSIFHSLPPPPVSRRRRRTCGFAFCSDHSSRTGMATAQRRAAWTD